MAENEVQLARWQSHKIVSAGEIISLNLAGRKDGPENTVWLRVRDKDGDVRGIDVPSEVFARGVPEVGDYFVVYDDNYQSWSPAKAFEEGYTRIG